MATTQSNTAEHLLRRFAVLANRSSLDARDWERFYGFIIVASRYRVAWDHQELARRLVELGLPRGLAQELGEIYWHCRCVLFARRRHYNFGSCCYGDWIGKRGAPLT